MSSAETKRTDEEQQGGIQKAGEKRKQKKGKRKKGKKKGKGKKEKNGKIIFFVEEGDFSKPPDSNQERRLN